MGREKILEEIEEYIHCGPTGELFIICRDCKAKESVTHIDSWSFAGALYRSAWKPMANGVICANCNYKLKSN